MHDAALLGCEMSALVQLSNGRRRDKVLAPEREAQKKNPAEAGF
jgi:hypothetical protein